MSTNGSGFGLSAPSPAISPGASDFQLFPEDTPPSHLVSPETTTPDSRLQLPPSAQEGTTSFRRTPLTFAVDISGSTRGRIITQEQAAITSICSTLELGIAQQSPILPWDRKAQGVLYPDNVKQLTTGAGTNPVAVLDNKVHRKHLQKSKLWFLMTDGYIEEPIVTKFANGIPGAGIHGTASVIILFGYHNASPFHCNVSVGMSVFAVSPHCLFLFHEVRSERVYVFQAKGCFAGLLPQDKQFVSFGKWSRWEDLHQISYDELAQISVPPPTKLSGDTVMLPNGRQFDMQSIYSNSVSAADKMELLSDYSSLDVIILAAKTRGTSAAVKHWIETSRSAKNSQAPELQERDDAGGAGLSIITTLINAVATPGTPSDDTDLLWEKLRTLTISDSQPTQEHNGSNVDINALRSSLRLQHKTNWERFEEKFRVETELSGKMDQVFDEVISTITQWEGHNVVPSPAILTPLSSPSIDSYQRVQRCSPLAREDYTGGTRKRQRHLPPASTEDLLFLPGFKGPKTFKYGVVPDNFDTCPVCGQPESRQTLLLRSNPDVEDETPHLPPPNRGAGHKYPLVLGNYPETDIIAPLTACDGCAFLLLKAGKLPGGGRITAALPLVSLKSEKNRTLWLQALSSMYEHRFHERITLLVFLSTLCSTIEDFIDSDAPESYLVRKSLEWCCKEICGLPGVSTMAGLTPVGSPLSSVVDSNVSMQDTLRLAFSLGNSTITESPLLSYPIDGFVALVRLASLVEDIQPQEIEQFLWKRLLYHFTEQHALQQQTLGSKEANVVLKGLLYGSASPSSQDVTTATSAYTSFSIEALATTYLLPEASGALDQFQRMGEFFSSIESTRKYSCALAVFLHLVHESLLSVIEISDVGDFFVRLRYRADKLRRTEDGLYDVFENPKLISPDVATRSVEKCYTMEASTAYFGMATPQRGSLPSSPVNFNFDFLNLPDA